MPQLPNLVESLRRAEPVVKPCVHDRCPRNLEQALEEWTKIRSVPVQSRALLSAFKPPEAPPRAGGV